VTLEPQARKAFILSSGLLALGVMIGAFGAHGLKSFVETDKLVTFETGVRYHFYHALGIMLIGILHQFDPNLKISFSLRAFFVGILLFCFNCYFYAVSGIKIFALIVPVGGLLFIVGWIALVISLLKLR
jgi:uncharacterized membrane protein YgdD (TMEM256/DUF423 family)